MNEGRGERARKLRSNPLGCGALTESSYHLLDSGAKNRHTPLAADVGQPVAGQSIEERRSFEERAELLGKVGAQRGGVRDFLNDCLAATNHVQEICRFDFADEYQVPRLVRGQSMRQRRRATGAQTNCFGGVPLALWYSAAVRS